MGRIALLVLSVILSLQLARSTYVAIVPKVFHPGWEYVVQLTANDVPHPGVRITVAGNIFNGKKSSLGASSVSLDNGESALLKIPVGANVEPDPNNVYTLQLDGTGGLTFYNFTRIQMVRLSRLTFIETDKKIYKAGQLIRFRVVVVNEDLVPQYIAKNITIENPMHSAVMKFHCNGKKAVYENTYQLSNFPDLGQWRIVVKSSQANVHEKITFTVDEYVLPTFEVSAEVTPGYLIKESNNQRFVTVSVTAKYTYGKGVKGDVRLTVGGSNQVVNTRITDGSGKKDVEVDLNRELAAATMGIPIRVEVTDETSRTYDTTITVRVEDKTIKLDFCTTRTNFVYRTGMPFMAVLKLTDPMGDALEPHILENQVTMTLKDRSNASNTVTKRFDLTPGQREVVWTISKINSTSSDLDLSATFIVKGRKYEATEYIKRYQVLGNATLNARWLGPATNLSMGSIAPFIVNKCNSTNFTSITYMIVSRGNIQTFGVASAGQRVNLVVTPEMCPKGKLVIYGITDQEEPEIIAHSLQLTVQHCQGKMVVPRVGTNSHRTGTETTLHMDVEWADPEKRQNVVIGEHDVYMLAVDKSVILLQGDNVIDPARVERQLDRFTLNASSGTEHGGGDPELMDRRKRSIVMPDHQAPTSTGALLHSLGLKLLGDVRMLDIPEYDLEELVTDGSETPTGITSTPLNERQLIVRKNFPDTWLWKTGRTNDRGKLTMEEKLPDTITSWVISAFAVRKDTELALTTNPFELKAVNPFFVTLNLPYSIRRTEKFQLRATVFNYENINMDTTVTLAPSDNYIISGDPTGTVMVRRNEASSVTFVIVASKVGTIDIRVTAQAQRSNGATITDIVTKKLIVKPEGMERMRVVTFPVVLSNEEPVFDRNVTLDFAPWSSGDVVPDSRRALVKVTGDMMGNALEDIEDLVIMPRGCGEQNMMSTIPNIYALTYLTAIDDLKTDFQVKAKKYMTAGYVREVQEYRWNNGGFSAFGVTDESASTWLTAFVLRSFAHAKTYIPETVDVDVLNTAVQFLFTRQNSGSGLFFERGNVLHTEMQGGTGSEDALSVYIAVCMLEAKKYGVELDQDKLKLAMQYVKGVAEGQRVRDNKFLAALTAYALALHLPKDPNTSADVDRLIRYIVSAGAPWTKNTDQDKDKNARHSWHYMPPPGPSDVEVTSYCLLALNTINRIMEARPLVLWLQRNQNSNGGFRSTQDTATALQAISEYAVRFTKTTPNGNVVVTALEPSKRPRSVSISSANAAVLQTVELPDQTNKVNIYVTGAIDSLSVVKVVWYFNTPPETEERPPSLRGHIDNNNKKLMVTTRTSMRKPGFQNVEACIKPEAGLRYDNMVMLSLSLPSGYEPEDILETRKRNTFASRVEHDEDKVHFYLNEPRKECANLVIEEKVKVENMKPGSALLYAYYNPDIKSEAEIKPPCTGGNCDCTGDDCDSSHAAKLLTISLPLLAACFCLLHFIVSNV